MASDGAFRALVVNRGPGMEQILTDVRPATTADRAVRALAAAACVGAVFWLNTRYVLAHFTQGASLLDTGWFAWIMASGDPWLTNPHAVSDMSYFNVHLTPYLSAVSVAVHAIGTDRFTAFAVHQGLVFALVAASLCALVLTSWRGPRSGLLLAAVIVQVLLGDTTLQIASFPHPEIAIIAFSLMGSVLWLNQRRGWALVPLALACLVREDGGLYMAAFMFALGLLRPLGGRTWRSSEVAVGAAGVVIALMMFWIKAQFFPGFSAFAFNYSGHHWDHLSADAMRLRLLAFVANPQALTTIVPALLLAALSWRYLIFPALMTPIIVAQLLAARAYLWQFNYYYALPFLVIWIGLMIVATVRARQGAMRRIEAAVLLAAVLCGASPVLLAAGQINSMPVFTVPFVWPTENLEAISKDAVAMAADVPGACASAGVAAVAPQSFGPEQVLDPDVSVARCRTVFLYRSDAFYPILTWQVAAWPHGPRIDGHLQRFDRPAWLMMGTRP